MKARFTARISTIILGIAFSSIAFAQLNLVPMPAETNVRASHPAFQMSNATKILYGSAELKKEAQYFSNELNKQFGLNITIMPFGAQKSPFKTPSLVLRTKGKGGNKSSEAYNLEVNSNSATLESESSNGIFLGLQTMLQLIEKQKGNLSIPALTINDFPRFSYRGMHLDVGRHFFPVDFIKKYIDYLAYHKYNTFHWHLTEDQGWRIEIKKYPRLTEIGSCRAQTLVGRYGSNIYDGQKYCGYYTQQQVKEIVQYASARHITVIPEIEMPGHSKAALAAYPELGCTGGPYIVHETWGVIDDVFCAGNEKTFSFLESVLSEVITLFPSKYIHIGGDESPKERWKHCAKCQQRIKEKGLKDEHELQSYFIQRMEKFLNSKGRKIIGWDEILEGGLAPNATVMSWRGEEGGIAAAKQKHDVIMTPGGWCYLDHSQTKNEDSVTIGGYTSVEKVYSYEPIPATLTDDEAKYVLGAQGNVWTEYMKNPNKVEYMIFPRMSALSEVLWSPKKNRSWLDFERRIPVLFERYKHWGANFSTAYYELDTKISNKDGIISWELSSKQNDVVIVYKLPDGTQKLYTTPININASGTYQARIETKSGHPLGNWITQPFNINKATGRQIALANEPNGKYKGFGAITLVDGIQNSKKLGRSSEFVGFLGNNMEAVIDLGKPTEISKILLHGFYQTDSWIHLPASVKYFTSSDGITYTQVPEAAIAFTDMPNFVFTASIAETARFVKIIAENKGKIPEPLPGAGNPAWLFVDEIEVQ